MKAEFELRLNHLDKPIIKFKHHYYSDSIDQNVLKQFINEALSKGIELKHRGGYSSYSEGQIERWENYEIQIKRP